MLLNSFIGKTVLWQGQPFLARTWFEPTASDFGMDAMDRAKVSASEGRFTKIFPDASASLRIPSIDRLPEDILGGDTDRISPGVYEVTISRHASSIDIPETVWILSRKDYIRLVRHEFSESEMPEPSIGNKEALLQHLECIKRTRWPDAPLSFEVIYNAAEPFSFGKIEGLISTVLDTFRYIAVFGMGTGAKATISINNENLEFGIQGDLEYPLPIEVESSISDPECSDLQLLKREKADHGEEIDFGVSIEGGRAQIRVQHSMPILNYA